MSKPPTPAELKAMSTADLIKRMNELLAELDARTARTDLDGKSAREPKPGRQTDDG